MDYTLIHLIDSLQSTLKVLKGPAKDQLLATLHDHDKLPDKRLADLASTAIDLLHETEQILEPGSLVLADHFLGILYIGYLNSKCLTAAVELNIPDILRHGPKTLPELAIEANANTHRLRQVLRILHNDGIFAHNASTDTYSNNSTSTLLLSDHWTQWRNWVDLYGNEFYDMARGIPASCRKDVTRMAGQVNFNTDTDMFTYFTEQGWLPRLHKTLSGGAEAQAPGILEDYPWEEVSNECFLDVGGGGGGLVALLLKKHRNMRAGILDTAKVIEHATKNFHDPKAIYADVGNRVSKENLIVGDFLVEIPSFGVYTMKWCLHDWDDSKALKVMSNIRKSIVKGPNSRLIILEALLTEGRMGRLARYGDLTMAISANGQERNEAQWRSLAAQTGWEVRNIFPMRNAWVCAIELVPA
ncbi:S-adenosyl-L-methionine-dependent methyltransferase, partial [Bisporella sp. PMI_857]